MLPTYKPRSLGHRNNLENTLKTVNFNTFKKRL